MSDAAPIVPWSDPLEGLPLACATPAGWAEVALADIDALLVDHAHCEQKAAMSALALAGRFADREPLVRPMLALAYEELHHFRQVIDLIEQRGGKLTRPEPDHYVRELRARAFGHPTGLGAYGDLLLVNGFVEARSCERFRLLAQALLAPGADADRAALGHFYRQLAQAEGRHWELFRDIALAELPAKRVERRVAAFAEVEAEILTARPLAPRMH